MPRNRLQTEGEDFHLMVGTCIVAWAEVDNALFGIFHRCVGPLRQCAIIYYRTPGLSARLGLTDELVKAALPGTRNGGKKHCDLVAWLDATQSFGDLLSVRRRIAHLPSRFTSGPLPGSFVARSFVGRAYPSPKPWFEIYTGETERLRKSSESKEPLKISDLEGHLMAVVGLRDRLTRFLCDVLPNHVEEPLQQSVPRR